MASSLVTVVQLRAVPAPHRGRPAGPGEKCGQLAAPETIRGMQEEDTAFVLSRIAAAFQHGLPLRVRDVLHHLGRRILGQEHRVHAFRVRLGRVRIVAHHLRQFLA